MQSVFHLHNTIKYEVYCYSLTPDDQSHWRRAIQTSAEHFIDIGHMHAVEAAQLIHKDGIHILINLNGYTKGSRNEIFALRPAPIQVTYSMIVMMSIVLYCIVHEIIFMSKVYQSSIEIDR